MARLKNLRWEQFAQCIARGMNARDAYLEANPTCKSRGAAAVGGHHTLAQEAVQARIGELKGWPDECSKRADEITAEVTERVVEGVAQKIIATRDWVRDELIKNVDIAMGRKAGPNGELKYDGSVANRALELLGKDQGMFVDRSENVNAHYEISDEPMTADQWRETYTGKPEAKKPN